MNEDLPSTLSLLLTLGGDLPFVTTAFLGQFAQLDGFF